MLPLGIIQQMQLMAIPAEPDCAESGSRLQREPLRLRPEARTQSSACELDLD